MRRRPRPTRPSFDESGVRPMTIIFGVGCVALILVGILVVTAGPNEHLGSMEVHGMGHSTLADYKKSIPVDSGDIEFGTSTDSRSIRWRKCHGVARKKGKIYPTIMLLHGKDYNSKLWEAMGIMQGLCAAHLDTVAIDLPMFGASAKYPEPSSQTQLGNFIFLVANKLLLNHFVLVSPSMSGKYGIPALINPDDKKALMSGFISVAADTANHYQKAQYREVQIPVMILYGERDSSEMAELAAKFIGFTHSPHNVIIHDAGHAPFVDKPEKFISEVLLFLNKAALIAPDSGGKLHPPQQHEHLHPGGPPGASRGPPPGHEGEPRDNVFGRMQGPPSHEHSAASEDSHVKSHTKNVKTVHVTTTHRNTTDETTTTTEVAIHHQKTDESKGAPDNTKAKSWSDIVKDFMFGSEKPSKKKPHHRKKDARSASSDAKQLDEIGTEESQGRN